MKIKAYDKYNEQELIIKLDIDDKINIDTYNSKHGWANIRVEFEAISGEDPTPERWSDLINFEIV